MGQRGQRSAFPFKRRVTTFCLFSALLLLAPVVLSLSLLFILVRLLLTLVKDIWLRDHNYGPFLTGMNNFFSTDSPYDCPRAIIVTYATIEGHLELSDLGRLLNQKLEEWENKKPHRWFPELQQYPDSFMGFAVMKWEKEFRLEDHLKKFKDVITEGSEPRSRSILEVNLNQEDPVNLNMDLTEKDVTQVALQLTRIPFKKGTSPWQFVVGYSGSNTVVFLRLHHTLGDGLSIVKLVSSLFDVPGNFESFIKKFDQSQRQNRGNKKEKDGGKKNSWVKSKAQQVVNIFWVPIVGLYEFSKALMSSWDKNEWHHGWPQFRRNIVITSLEGISMEKIRRIRKARGGIRFSTVMAAALTVSLRKFMQSKHVEVPPAMHAGYGIPIPESATRLCNNVTIGLVTIPCGLERRSEILSRIERDYSYNTTSLYPKAMLGVFKLINTFPRRLLANYWIFTTVGLSNVPGVEGQLKICDKPVLKMQGFTIPPAATTGVYLQTVGYNGQVFVTLGVSDHITSSRAEVEEIRRYFVDELEALQDPNNDHIDN